MHVEGFPDKDGIDKLVKLGKAICRTVQIFTPLLLRKYPDNPTITALLAAINTMCGIIPQLEAEFLVEGGDNSDPLDDPDMTTGVNPSLPPAPDPETT